MPCHYCGKEKVTAKGLCQACYVHQRTHGTLERTLSRNKGKTCSVADCTALAVCKGMCRPHYDQSWGSLYWAWKTLKSRRHGPGIPVEWHNFDRFAADVGKRPGERYQLRRKDTRKPHGLGNTMWLPPVGLSTKEERSQYSKAWNFLRHHGVSVEDYERMLADQGGVCAICGKPEKQVIKKTGKVRALALDHCHAHGHIRSLLCCDCNHLLGCAKDDPDLLRRAAAYLERHAS